MRFFGLVSVYVRIVIVSWLLRIIAGAHECLCGPHNIDLSCAIHFEFFWFNWVGAGHSDWGRKTCQGMKTYAIMANFVICVPDFAFFFKATFSDFLKNLFFDAKYHTHLCCWHNIIQHKT